MNVGRSGNPAKRNAPKEPVHKVYVVSHRSAAFLVYTTNDKVTKAPDIAQQFIGKPVASARNWYKRHGCAFYLVQLPEGKEINEVVC